MNPFRNFKTLGGTELVALLPEADISGTEITAAVAGLVHQLPPNHYEKLVADGVAKSTVIQFAGYACYRVVWQSIVQGTQLSVLVAQQLGSFSDSRVLGAGLDKLAESMKATAIIFTTARRALIEQCQTWGAYPVQVLMKKDYAW